MRRIASDERQKAGEEKRKAEEARRLAEKQRDRAEFLVYAGQIRLAQQEWQHGDAALAWHHLESCQRNLRGWEHNYLFALFTKNTFQGPTFAVRSVAYSPDGKRIVSGSWVTTLKVWDASKEAKP